MYSQNYPPPFSLEKEGEVKGFLIETFAKRSLRAHKSFSTPQRLAQGFKG